MERNLLLKGAIIGFSIAMAVGPIALLCIRNSLTRGFSQGFATGLGAAFADAIYGALAGFGVVAITTALLHYAFLLQMGGGVFLCYLGLAMFRAKEARERKEIGVTGFWPIFCTTLFLTLANPMTIVSFIAIYTGLGVTGENSLMAASLLTSGVFLGSASWYLILSAVTSVFKNQLNATAFRWLNRISGCIILGFGIASLVVSIR